MRWLCRDGEDLRQGEVDRLALTIQNLRQMGAKVGEMPDGLVVQGPVHLEGTEVDAGGDALTGLTFALAGLVAEGETRVSNTGDMCRDFAGIICLFIYCCSTKRGENMKILFKLALFAILTILGGVAFIRYTYGCSWRESFDIADEFMNDVLGGNKGG